MQGVHRGWISTRALAITVSAVLVVSFLTATVALAVAISERGARVEALEKITVDNTTRLSRNCHRYKALIAYVNGLDPLVDLDAAIDTIDKRYPTLQPFRDPCPKPDERGGSG